MFSATFYWFPKMTGRMLSERLGKLQFWLWVFGLNATFMSQHFLGVMGMPRRVYTYADNPGWMVLNAIATVGAVAMAVGTLVLLWNVWTSLRSGQRAGNNPWGGFTLEWATTSPPPEENFDVIPEVKSRRPVWDLDHPDLADWKTQPRRPKISGRRPDKAVLLAWAFVASEAVFFMLLLVSYVVFNSRSLATGPTAATALDVTRTGIFTICLLGQQPDVLVRRTEPARRAADVIPRLAGDHDWAGGRVHRRASLGICRPASAATSPSTKTSSPPRFSPSPASTACTSSPASSPCRSCSRWR